MHANKGLYQAPAVRTPSLGQLRDLAGSMGLDLTEQDLQDYQGYLKNGLAVYNILDKYAEPLPPVKYPRTPGYRPPPEENTHNAWYYKTDIKGASSGFLAGKKVAIKDNIAVAGVPMMNGSKLMEGYTPEFDATIVTRILDAGGNIAGKAACEDLCCGGGSFTSSTGPVLNYHDKTRDAGGSSSGSAVLVASGEVDMAIGGDQGGSIRLPACWTGVVGLKPTWGLVPYTGAISVEPSLDHLGPMARTVEECALLLQAIAGFDAGLDARQPANLEVPNYVAALTGNLDGIRVGILTEGFEGAEPDVEKMVKDAALKLRSAGASVEEVSLPIHKDGLAIWSAVCFEGGYYHMIAHSGIAFGMKSFQPTSIHGYMSNVLKTKINDLPITAKYAVLSGKYMEEYYQNRFYMKGVNVGRTLTKEYNKVLESYDVLIMPTIKYKAPKLPLEDISNKEYMESASGMEDNTCPFNVTGHPAMNINAGFSDKLPVGMMIVGRHFDETTVLRVGHAYEQLSSV